MNRAPKRAAAKLQVQRSHETLREKTVERLREAILEQYFSPGDRLIERELCDLTGVSRTSVREALRQLESDGLVESIPHRGPIVASLSLQDASNIYEMREALDALAARLFVERASNKEIKSLVRAGDRVATSVRGRDVRNALNALDDFYDVLYDGCGNPIAAATIRTLRARMHYLRARTTHQLDDPATKRTVKNFQKIVSAVKKRDGDAAAAACIAQVQFAADYAKTVLSSQE